MEATTQGLPPGDLRAAECAPRRERIRHVGLGRETELSQDSEDGRLDALDLLS